MSGRGTLFSLVLPLVLQGGYAEAQRPVPFERTEVREDCDSYDPLRQAFFGATHLHTGLSFDASLRLVRPGPRAAYRFARGDDCIVGTDHFGLPSRQYCIDRPLDFGAVTDHSEHFSEMGICNDPERPGHFSFECQLLRGFFWSAPALVPPTVQRNFAQTAFSMLVLPNIGASSFNSRLPLCEASTEARMACDASESSVWDEMKAAAEEAYDRTRECRFTSFIGYEVTSTPSGTNWHRNVIFRNDRVVDTPVTAIDMAFLPNPDPRHLPPQFVPHPDVNKLWQGLYDGCLDPATGKAGCDVITIPHNSNLGSGSGTVPELFFWPKNPEEAKRRQQFEPLVEIYQVKGSSECRYDPRTNPEGGLPFGGVETTDEYCDFELLDQAALSGASAASGSEAGAPGPEDFATRAFVRNVLKDGLLYDQQYPGTNPFKLGIIADADNHNGTMGWHPENETFLGHAGIEDAEPAREYSTLQTSSGGHTVVWAEENSRDAIFAALKRKETYGTSGTRPHVRFFGGWDFAADVCDGNGANVAPVGYDEGVPMGGDLPARPEDAGAPRFVAAAWMDDVIQTPIQQIQVIKGWVDAAGETHEEVYVVAGDPNGGATVDPQTCEPQSNGSGSDFLCGVFEDPDFDPSERAFYYVRVLENPVCRYSTLMCMKRFGVNPLDPDCETQLAGLDASARRNAEACCNNEDSRPGIVQPVIQERAWTSPIWYTPGS